MEKLVIASMHKNAGKTSVILGLAKVSGKKIGYMKPFGDRLHYHKKRLWDYDSALVANILTLKENPEDMSIGFEYSKLRYMYDEEGIKEKLLESISKLGQDKDILFIEGGKNLTYGISVHLDALSVAKYIDGKLLIVISGNEDSIVDDITFFKDYLDVGDSHLGGIIINKVHDPEDFQTTHLGNITEMGINVLGIIPYKAELTHFSIDYLSSYLFAKVLAGQGGLNKVVKNIFVGAMSADAALRKPLFRKESKLIITSGDRNDMILAALNSDTACIILTNNILPPSNIISKAADRNIPLLLVPLDTYQITKRIDSLPPLLTKDDTEKIDLIGQLARNHLKIREIC